MRWHTANTRRKRKEQSRVAEDKKLRGAIKSLGEMMDRYTAWLCSLANSPTIAERSRLADDAAGDREG
jgi:hypothetical protein